MKRGVGLSINKGSAVVDLYVGELAEGKVLAIGSGDQQILDGVHVLAVRLLHADQKVELALALNDL